MNANFYADVNGDHQISAADALAIINHLHRQSLRPSAEAESSVLATLTEDEESKSESIEAIDLALAQGLF